MWEGRWAQRTRPRQAFDLLTSPALWHTSSLSIDYVYLYQFFVVRCRNLELSAGILCTLLHACDIKSIKNKIEQPDFLCRDTLSAIHVDLDLSLTQAGLKLGTTLPRLTGPLPAYRCRFWRVLIGCSSSTHEAHGALHKCFCLLNAVSCLFL